ncbi:10 kDa heat shock protein, mitochondrial-like [Erinaceus europaeus]|uniref:10 kDa heat shock protein, mitochondrial-like n=1 Tax=Erinaceus europaeus TaxID=9365 RepID=A0ABM3W0N1_ERIEU|nr:10 kDa heat shock protein, mitochondrial-like [Erinaceus europaeus]
MAEQAFRKLLPLFEQVLLERSIAETVTKGGITLPEESQEKVVVAGLGTKRSGGKIQPFSMRVGGKVPPDFGGTILVLNDEDSYLEVVVFLGSM